MGGALVVVVVLAAAAGHATVGTAVGLAGLAAGVLGEVRARLACRALRADHERSTREHEELLGMLRRRDSDRDFVLTAISHRLRTPVTVLHGLLQLRATKGPLDPSAAFRIEDTLMRQSQHLVRLVDDLTDVTALTLSPPSAPHLVSVHALIEDAVARVADRHPLDDVAIDCDAGLMAKLDPTFVVLCLSHLLANAVLHGAPPVVVSARARDGSVTLTVTDHGAGLPRGVDVFASLSWGAPGAHDPGLGVGLAVVARRVKAMGGLLRSTTRPDVDGTEMSIVLPTTAVERRRPQGRPHIGEALDRLKSSWPIRPS